MLDLSVVRRRGIRSGTCLKGEIPERHGAFSAAATFNYRGNLIRQSRTGITRDDGAERGSMMVQIGGRVAGAELGGIAGRGVHADDGELAVGRRRDAGTGRLDLRRG